MGIGGDGVLSRKQISSIEVETSFTFHCMQFVSV